MGQILHNYVCELAYFFGWLAYLFGSLVHSIQ